MVKRSKPILGDSELIRVKVEDYLIIFSRKDNTWEVEIWFDMQAPGISEMEDFLLGEDEIELMFIAYKKIMNLMPY